MGFLDNLIDDYLVSKPKNYDFIAAELHKGNTPIQVRKKLIEEKELSQLAAGTMVESVQKKIKIMKINVRSGSFFTILGVVSFILNPGAIVTYLILFGGAIQLYAGIKERKEYQKVVT